VFESSGRNAIYTLGHSSHTWAGFVDLLQQHSIQVVCDVRSMPYSRKNPQYNRETLKSGLRAAGIRYGFFGSELGGRSDDPNCYQHGKVQYDRLAKREEFLRGLQRLVDGATQYRLVLLCAEREPLDCHRAILVAPYLVDRGVEVIHILGDGRAEHHRQTTQRLIRQLQLDSTTYVNESEELVALAYRIRAQQVAFALPSLRPPATQITMSEFE
jgi:uncharacterized protein (DUF488 family)